MNSKLNLKKIILIIVSIIIFVRIGYIMILGEVDREYYTPFTYDLTDVSVVSCAGATQVFRSDKGRLNSLEMVFSNVADDKVGEIELQILSEEELIYQTGISLYNVENWEWVKIYVNAELSPEKEYKIVFTPTENCTQIPNLLVVKKGCPEEIIGSKSNDNYIEGEFVINYGYLEEADFLDRIITSSLWIWLWLGVYGVIYYQKRIRKALLNLYTCIENYIRKDVFVPLLELVLCAIILENSLIEFTASTKIIFYVISFLAIIRYSEKREYALDISDTWWKKGLIYLLYLYAAFSLVGQRIWIYPLTLKITISGIFVFLCTVIWVIPIINSGLYYLEKLSTHSFSNSDRLKTGSFVFICISLLIFPAVYNLYANNPGISSEDTVTCLVQNAHHLHGMNNWHPPFYCMILGLIIKIWDSTYAIIIAHYLFWVYVIIELIILLRKMKIKESILIIVTVLFGFNTANIIHLNSIFKDIPYTVSLLWSLIIIAKLAIYYDEYKYKWYIYLELIVALVGVYFYRKNGMVSCIIMLGALITVLRKNIKVWAAGIISIMLILMINGPIYRYFEVQDLGKYGMYIGLSQDILGVYYSGGEVSEDTLQMINVMTNYNNSEYKYNPTFSFQAYGLEVEIKEFIINYIDTFVKNPITMARAIIAREDLLWNIFQGEDANIGAVNYTNTMDGRDPLWNEYYPARKYVSLYPQAQAFVQFTVESQWISVLIWRGGLFTLLGLTVVVLLIVKKGIDKYLLIVTPSIGHILGLLLSTGWSDIRYYWPLNLLNMTIILLGLLVINQEKENKNCYE